MIAAVLYGLTFAGFFLSVEVTKRLGKYKPEQTRRVVHIGSSLITASMAFWTDRWVITSLALVFMVLLGITRSYHWFTSLQGVQRKTIGEFTFALGTISAAWVLLPDHPLAFMFGFIVLALADTSAQLIGERFPLRSFLVMGQRKSLGGALSFLIVSMVLTLLMLLYIGQIPGMEQLVVMTVMLVVLTAAEATLTYGLDNTIIPVASGWVLTILMNG